MASKAVEARIKILIQGDPELQKLIASFGNLQKEEAEAVRAGKELHKVIQQDVAEITRLARAAKEGSQAFAQQITKPGGDPDAFARVFRAATDAAAKSGKSLEEVFASAEKSATHASGRISAHLTEAFNNPKKSIEIYTATVERMFVRLVALRAVQEVMKIVQTAFESVVEAAKFDDMTKAFDNMSVRMGVGSQQLLKAMREVSRGTVDDLKLMQTAVQGMALTEGVLSQDIPKALALVRVASQATGKDVDVLFEKLMLGIGRLSPRLIDDLGLSVKLSQAYENYANQIGKTASSLTAIEQRQALWNETMRAAEKVYGDYLKGVDLTTDVFKRAEVSTERLKRVMGESLLPSVKDLTAWWANLANALADATERHIRNEREVDQTLKMYLRQSTTLKEYIELRKDYLESLTGEQREMAASEDVAIRLHYAHMRSIAITEMLSAATEAQNAKDVEWRKSLADLSEQQSYLAAVLSQVARSIPTQEAEDYIDKLITQYGVTSQTIEANAALVASFINAGKSIKEAAAALTDITQKEDVYFRMKAAQFAAIDIRTEASQERNERFLREMKDAVVVTHSTLDELKGDLQAVYNQVYNQDISKELARQYRTIDQVAAAMKAGKITRQQGEEIVRAWRTMASVAPQAARQIETTENTLTDALRDTYNRRLDAMQKYYAQVDAENSSYERRIYESNRDFNIRLADMEEEYYAERTRAQEEFQRDRLQSIENFERQMGTDAKQALTGFLEERKRLQAENNIKEIEERRKTLVRVFGVDMEAMLDRIEAEDADFDAREKQRREDYEKQRNQAKRAHQNELDDLKAAHRNRLREIQRALAQQQAEINRAYADRLASLIAVLKDEDYAILKEYGPEGLARINWRSYTDWLSAHPAIRQVITQYISQGTTGGGGGTSGTFTPLPPEEGQPISAPSPEPTPTLPSAPSPVPSIPPPSGTCFVAGTKISTPSGYKSIETLRVGDKVFTWNGTRLVETEITEVYVHHDEPVWQVVLWPNIVLGVTPNHPVFSWEKKDFVQIGTLRIGDQLTKVNRSGKLVPVTLIGFKKKERNRTVYNIEVKHEAHNYLAYNLIVHNPRIKQFGMHTWVDNPMLLLVGEAGRERVDITPEAEYRKIINKNMFSESPGIRTGWGILEKQKDVNVQIVDRQAFEQKNTIILDGEIVNRSVSRRQAKRIRTLSYFISKET